MTKKEFGNKLTEANPREEVLETLYKEAVVKVFNQTLKDNDISSFGTCGIDMSKTENLIMVASIIGANSTKE